MPANNTASKGIISQAAGGSERRRSSASSGKFAGLVGQKRNSTDISASARKASFAEQKPAPGIIGSMWNSWTKGSGPANKS